MLNNVAIVEYFKKTSYALPERGSANDKYNPEIAILCPLYIHLS